MAKAFLNAKFLFGAILELFNAYTAKLYSEKNFEERGILYW
jgi:hypothetical protein